MRTRLILSYLGIILWILSINLVATLFVDDLLQSQALSIAVGLAVGLIFGISVSNSVADQLGRLGGVAAVVSGGDLTQDIPVHSDDEIGRLALAFRKMLISFREIVANVKRGSSGVMAASNELYEALKSLSEINELVATKVEHVAKAAEDQSGVIANDTVTLRSIYSSVSKIASMANVASQSAGRAVKNSQEGKEAAQSAIGQIQNVFALVEKTMLSAQGLGAKVTKVSRVLEIMTDIARKTDMLSLNATVEASKAGEYGKGFGIVAEEIRYLTEESKSAAKEIGAMVDEIQGESLVVKSSIQEGVIGIGRGREMIGTLIQSFDRVVEEVTRLGGGFEAISIETQRQAMDTERITQTFSELTKLAQDNAQAMQKTAVETSKGKGILERVQRSGHTLRDTAGELTQAIAQFKVADG